MGLQSLIILLFFIGQTSSALGSACCGGGAALPTLITGDYKAQVSLSGTNSAITHDSNSQGQIKKRHGEIHQITETLNISTAYLLSPYWQIGMSAPFIKKTYKSQSKHESTQGMGDLKAQLAYEFLPEYSFSLWRPRGFLFIQQTFPTSHFFIDKNETSLAGPIDNNYFSTALGISFVKTINSFDMLFMGESHKAYYQKTNFAGKDIHINSALSYSMLLSLGYSPFNDVFRLGGSLLYSHEGKKSSDDPLFIGGQSSEYWELGANLSYLYDSYSLTLSYRNQSYLGKAKNTALTQSISLSLLRFFDL